MPRKVKTPLLAALACAMTIPPLAVAAYSTGALQNLDMRVFMDLQREDGPAHGLAAMFVNFGDLVALLLLLVVIVAWGLRLGRRREVIAAIVIVSGANLSTQILKTALEHARWKAFEHGIELPWPNSFPSGHTTAAASIAVALLLVAPAAYRARAAVAGTFLVAAVAISTVVLGWHYPSDVLGGLLVVGTWGFAALAYLRLRGDRDPAPKTDEHRRPRPLVVPTD